MVSKKAVEEQLKRIGFSFKFWGRAEVNELNRIILDDEIIAECTNGEYANGFALLVATNHRVLLVDKKPMLYLTVEDLRYDMITEFNFSHRMLNATINLYTANKTLTFMSWNQARLRRLLEYTQQRVLEMRQQNHMAQQFQAAAAAQYAQMHAASYYQSMPAMGYPGAAGALPADPPQPVMEPSPVTPAVVESVQTQSSGTPSTTIPAPTETSYNSVEPHTLVSRFAAKRAALGTYTRSRLPALRRHEAKPAHNPTEGSPQTGEVYPQGYTPGGPVTDYGMPYEY